MWEMFDPKRSVECRDDFFRSKTRDDVALFWIGYVFTFEEVFEGEAVEGVVEFTEREEGRGV